MASICNLPNGRRRIMFIGADGNRRSIRLGKVSMRQAEAIKVKDLVAARISGHAPADETSRWLAGLYGTMIKKLSRVGLTKQRGVATLGAFTEGYINSRVDIKPRTSINLNQARSYLLEAYEKPA